MLFHFLSRRSPCHSEESSAQSTMTTWPVWREKAMAGTCQAHLSQSLPRLAGLHWPASRRKITRSWMRLTCQSLLTLGTGELLHLQADCQNLAFSCVFLNRVVLRYHKLFLVTGFHGCNASFVSREECPVLRESLSRNLVGGVKQIYSSSTWSDFQFRERYSISWSGPISQFIQMTQLVVWWTKTKRTWHGP